ncbi:NADH-quinone oxidoreductase subunit J [Cellulomonas wangsupingiae]|uniref:NADH-quinone oxidoreductase subunit J n=1 Tax=Cellulomonas wangsupingiae TaxID=2968085 RepID=A0ABY5K1B9_9CELL|nr:NADH-quinone oxidoreductase subunit J [Cellulomonas wangsupingiae]MCC2335587.1 NADH-quinone oxidoreductase subunit J [Cellulomonas wangsupingiae]UUI64249.1 NADH-quinone oxidoreductase subunit J [Cellulomonas wangsupingiae]
MSTLLTALPAAAGALTESGQTSTAEAVLFWTLGPLMVLAALGLLFARKAVHAALAIVFVMISLAFMYVAQGAEFLGVVQVVVYTGAVMMLFLFVLMLVGVDRSDSLVETIRGQRWVGLLAGLGLAVVLVGVVGRATYGPPTGLAEANTPSNPEAVARLIFGQHVLAMEVVGALLVTAALGALVLTHRRRLTPKVGQRELAERRLRDGGHPVSLPAPGVYARHNAMDVPALLPDGTPLESSVPRVLRVRGQEADASEYAARIDRVLAGGWAVGGGTFTSDDDYRGEPGGPVAGTVTVREADAAETPTHDEEDAR